MALPRLSNLEMQIMEAPRTGGDLSVRDILETFPAGKRLIYSIVPAMGRQVSPLCAGVL